MKTLNLKEQYKSLYVPSAKKAALVQVPKLQFAMIDGAIEKGKGPGTSPGFAEATQALYGISYTLKFTQKKRKTNAIDYPVMALEGLWGLKEDQFDISVLEKDFYQFQDNWTYTLMIMQPSIITPDLFEEAREQVRRKKGDSPALSKVKLGHFEEGLCVQIMHIGPYATEPATIDLMKVFMSENGYRDNVGPRGKHHEIYLGDPRKADPAKLKTVLRHPVIKI